MALANFTRISGAIGAITLGLALSSCSALLPTSQPVRDAETGEITEETDRADVFQITVGDCLNTSSVSNETTTVPTVPCSESHEDEVYYAFDLPEGDFPGDESVMNSSNETCAVEFESFIGAPYADSTLDFYPFTPTAGSWSAGDREVLCVAYDPAGMITGTLKGSAR